MQRNEPESIGDILRLTIQEANMSQKLYECKAVETWPLIVGEGLAKKCGKPIVKNGVMSVPVGGAALRHELTMNRSSLIRLINGKVGRDVIKEMRFVGG